MISPAPIALFVYNRLSHTQRTVESILRSDLISDSDVFIFSDGYKSEIDKEKVLSVRKYIASLNGFKSKTIIEREKNFGLANSVIDGINQLFLKYDKGIVLEDDILCSSDFLSYMNKALEYYQAYKNVYSVTGYTFPIKFPDDYKHDVYFSPRPSSWGWGTWADRWKDVDWKVGDYGDFITNKEQVRKFNLGGRDLTNMLTNYMNGQIDSWAIRWSYAHFKNNAYCLYPVKSRVQNIGVDNTGTHMKKSSKYFSKIEEKNEDVILLEEVKLDSELMKNFGKFFDKNILIKILGYFKRHLVKQNYKLRT